MNVNGDKAHPPLYEKYRPQTWADVVAQDDAIHKIALLKSRGRLGGQCYWISGKSGTGKTTIARLIAAEIADKWNVEECARAGSASPSCATSKPTPKRESRSTWRPSRA